MLLVVDVGNTNTVIGVYNKKKLKTKFRITTNQIVTSDEIVQILYNFLAIHKIDKENLSKKGKTNRKKNRTHKNAPACRRCVFWEW